MAKKTIPQLKQHLEGFETFKKVGHNRLEVHFNENRKGYTLHNTTVVLVDEGSHTIRLDSGGFHTVTTAKAMNEGLQHFGIHGIVNRKGGVLHFNGTPFKGDTLEVRF